MDIRKKTGSNVIAIKSPEGKFIINPDPNTIIKTNTKLILLGNIEQIQLVYKIYAKN